MVVYVEDAIFVEMLINIILVSLTICMTKLRSSKFRVVLSASFGTLCSILITFVGIKNSIIVFALKLLCGIVMVIILQGKAPFQKYLYTYFVLLLFTFVHGGLMLMLCSTFSLSISPVFVLVAISLMSYLVYQLVKKFYRTRTINNFKYKVRLDFKGKREYIHAYLDSGNLLTDENSGLPILILGFATFEHIVGVSLVDFISGNISRIIPGHYQLCSTISSSSKIYVFNVDSIYLCTRGLETKINAVVGTSYSCRFPSDSQALISPLMLSFAQN